MKDARFSTPERRDIQQITFPDEAAVAEASAKIKSGASFESIAADRKLTEKDIELGLLQKSDIADPALANAAFALPRGEVSQPVKTAFGYAILRVSKIEPGSTKPFADVSSELKREIASQRAKSQVQKLHDAIEDQRSAGKSLSDAAKSVGLEARKIEQRRLERIAADAPVRRERSERPPAAVEDVAVAAVPAGQVEAPCAAGGGEVDTGAVARVVSELVARADMHPDPERIGGRRGAVAVVRCGDHDHAGNSCRRFEHPAKVKELQSGGDFQALASAASLQVQHSNEVKRSGAAGFTPGAIVQVFNVPTGSVGQAAADGGSRMVFHVLDSVVQPYDADKPDSKQIAEQLKSGLAEDLISEYVRRLQNDYGVSVNPGALQAATGGDSGY